MHKHYIDLGIAFLLASALAFGLVGSAPAQTPDASNVSAVATTGPTTVLYQGYLTVGGNPYNGTGFFKFAIVNATGTVTYWSNDGTSSGGSAPVSVVPVEVSKGYFNVLLGATISGMTQPLLPTVFSAPGRYLRVWFGQSALGPFNTLSLVPFAAAPYSLNSETLDGLDSNQFAAANHTHPIGEHNHWGQTWSGNGDSSGLTIFSSTGVGVEAHSTSGNGVYGYSQSNSGVHGDSVDGWGVEGRSENSEGVHGESTNGNGVYGYSQSNSGLHGESVDGWGVEGRSENSEGVHGESTGGTGVYGGSTDGSGVEAHSVNGNGVYAYSENSSGVHGDSVNGWGVEGRSENGEGVHGESTSGTGVYGGSTSGVGVEAHSVGGNGVYAYSESNSGVHGESVDGWGVEGTSVNSVGVYGRSDSQPGVWGESSNSVGIVGHSQNYEGVVGWSEAEATGSNAGVVGVNTGAGVGVSGESNTGNLFEGWRGEDSAQELRFIVANDGSILTKGNLYVEGNSVVTGTKSAVVQTLDYGVRKLYAVESPGVWFEDFGTATLTGGQAEVVFEPIFVQTVNPSVNYHVFLTPLTDEPVVLFVTDKTATGFTVQGVTLGGQPAVASFDWRVVLKRKGYEDARLPEAGQ